MSTFKGVVVCTKAQYDALTKDQDTLYAVTDKTIPVPSVADAGKFLVVDVQGAAAWTTVPNANGEVF